MSFCRITGRSRNLPKPHYFPIIPPISPADAQRICRVTGKSFGLPMHHYIPVLLRRTTAVSKCRITKVASVFGKRRHFPLAGFKYFRPIIDAKNESQKCLIDLITMKAQVEGADGSFVYTVKERRSSLIFPAPIELAVRDGDIKDVMLVKDSDKVLLKMKQGVDISLTVQEVDEEEYANDEELYEGEGVAAEDDVVQVKKKQKLTMGLAQIFEQKEKKAIEDDVVLVKKKIKKENKAALMVSSNDWRNLIEPLVQGCDWTAFEQEASKNMVISKWNPPENHTARMSNELLTDKKISTPLDIMENAINELSPAQLLKTDNVFDKLVNGEKHTLEKLPNIHEIQDIVRKLATGTSNELETVAGMNVFTDKSRFIVGQMVKTSNGQQVFVPGHTVNGTFVPGFVVNTHEGPAIIPGYIFAKQKHSAVFLPGHKVITETGSCEFVSEKLVVSCKAVVEDVSSNELATVEGYEVRVENGSEYLEKCQVDVMCEEQVKVEGVQEEMKMEAVEDEMKIEVVEEQVKVDVIEEVKVDVVEEVNVDVVEEQVKVDVDVIAEVKIDVAEEIHIGALDNFVNEIQKESNLNIDTAKKIAENYNFENVNLDEVSKILLTVTHFAQNIFRGSTVHEPLLVPRTNGVTEEYTKNCDILKNALFTAAGVIHDNPNASNDVVYNALAEIFANLENKDETVSALCTFLNTHSNCNAIFSEIIEQHNHKLPNVSKVDILKSALNVRADQNLIIEKLSSVIEEDLLAPAFQNVSQNNVEFVNKVLQHIKEKQTEIVNEQNAYEILQVAIVSAMKEMSEQHLNSFITNEDTHEFKELLKEAIGLAVALGMDETADSLCTIIADPQSTHLLADDPLTLEILKRLTIMRQLAEKQPTLHDALLALKRNPTHARTDPKLRTLVRESAILMVPDVPNLNSSENIPTRLFCKQNTLAMEDFLARNRQPGTLLIIKRGLQAVVPKEASRAVLNGQVAYTLIDETGIRHFKPLDVFSALRLSKLTTRRFSGYECLGACERLRQSNADKAKRSHFDRMNPRIATLNEA